MEDEDYPDSETPPNRIITKITQTNRMWKIITAQISVKCKSQFHTHE